MKIIELTKTEIINILSDKENIVGQGCYGTLYKYDETTLVKLYYKEFFMAFCTLDEQIFEKEIEEQLSLIKSCKRFGIKKEDKFKEIYKKYKQLQFTDSYSLLKGVVTYKNYVIGVLLEYYKDYENLEDVYFYLSIKEKTMVLQTIKKLLENLIEHNIYARDIKENNVMINRNNLDVKLIDLDDREAIIEKKSYVNKYPYIKKECLDKYNQMTKRLIKKYGL